MAKTVAVAPDPTRYFGGVAGILRLRGAVAERVRFPLLPLMGRSYIARAREGTYMGL